MSDNHENVAVVCMRMRLICPFEHRMPKQCIVHCALSAVVSLPSLFFFLCRSRKDVRRMKPLLFVIFLDVNAYQAYGVEDDRPWAGYRCRRKLKAWTQGN